MAPNSPLPSAHDVETGRRHAGLRVGEIPPPCWCSM